MSEAKKPFQQMFSPESGTLGERSRAIVSFAGEALREKIINRTSPEKAKLLRQIDDLKKENEEKDRQIEQMGIDPVTGILNRVGFEKTLEKRERRLRSDKHNRPGDRLADPAGITSVVMVIDADKFKEINDTYGHDYGDMALAAIARIIESQVREGDIISRTGGDEFQIVADVFPSIEGEKQIDSHTNAQKVAQRISEALQTVSFGPEEKELSVHCSVGAYIDKDCVKDKLLKYALVQADKRSYAAKRKKQRARQP